MHGDAEDRNWEGSYDKTLDKSLLKGERGYSGLQLWKGAVHRAEEVVV